MGKDRLFIAKNLPIVSIGTLLSRILGFVRDMVIASFFGTSTYTDAFFVAFRIPNLFRRFLGEGALTASFIPVLSGFLKEKGKSSLKEVMDSSFSLLFILLLILVFFGEIGSGLIIKIIAPGFSKSSDKFYIGVNLLRVVFPYIFFISMVALSMGILNTVGHFFAPSVSPALLNISMIASCLLLFRLFKPPVFALAFGVILGGISQLLFQIPFIKKETGYLPRFTLKIRHPVITESAKLMIPAFFGLAVAQLNILIGTALASFLPTGGISYLYYADRLFQFPLGVFSIALGTVVLPLFSQSALVSREKLLENLEFSLRFSFYLSIPAAMGLIFLRTPIISTLFFRGKFSEAALFNTGLALLGYSIGIPSFSGIKVLVPAFYSLKDTKTPFYVSIVSLITNTVLGIVLLKPLKHFGLALANSIASWVNFFLLFLLLDRKLKGIKGKEVVFESMLSTISSIPIFMLSLKISRMALWLNRGMFFKKLALLIPLIVFLGLIFFTLSYILKVPSFMETFSLLKKRFVKYKIT